MKYSGITGVPLLKKQNKSGKKKYERAPTERDEIYDAGKYSAKRGKSKSDNPYKKDSEEYEAWNEGFEIGTVSH